MVSYSLIRVVLIPVRPIPDPQIQSGRLVLNAPKGVGRGVVAHKALKAKRQHYATEELHCSGEYRDDNRARRGAQKLPSA